MHGDGDIGLYNRAMNRCSIIGAISLVVILLGPVGCCAHRETPRRISRINHVVLIKLLDPGLAGQLESDCRNRLERIPTVTGAFTGRHGDFGRTGIDDGYDVGFFVSFDTDEAYRGYLEHPDHVDFITEWRPKIEWIRIHDVVDETAR